MIGLNSIKIYWSQTGQQTGTQKNNNYAASMDYVQQKTIDV